MVKKPNKAIYLVISPDAKAGGRFKEATETGKDTTHRYFR